MKISTIRLQGKDFFWNWKAVCLPFFYNIIHFITKIYDFFFRKHSKYTYILYGQNLKLFLVKLFALLLNYHQWISMIKYFSSI